MTPRLFLCAALKTKIKGMTMTKAKEDIIIIIYDYITNKNTIYVLATANTYDNKRFH